METVKTLPKGPMPATSFRRKYASGNTSSIVIPSNPTHHKLESAKVPDEVALQNVTFGAEENFDSNQQQHQFGFRTKVFKNSSLIAFRAKTLC